MLARIFGVPPSDVFPWMDFPFPCEIHMYHPHETPNTEAKKILCAFTEPPQLLVSREWVQQNYNQFDLIFTYDRELSTIENVRIINFGSLHTEYVPTEKSFSVSFLLSSGCGRADLEGYSIRRNLLSAFRKSDIKINFFLSSARLVITRDIVDEMMRVMEAGIISVFRLEEKKDPMFTSMFHVAIENTKVDNYFTEKLIDCFRTYTVPIYYGTDRVVELFDRNGIIIVNNENEISDVISSLKPSDYWDRLEAIKNNFKIAEKYINPMDVLHDMIMNEFARGRTEDTEKVIG